MPAHRFFFDGPLKENSSFILNDIKECHHMAKVMKVTIGEHVEVVNGAYQLAFCSVEDISPKKISLKVQELKEFSRQSSLTIYQALPRPHRLDVIIEKGTELGISRFCFFPGEKSELHQLTPNRLIRLKNLSIAAMKQCGRVDLPVISVMKGIASWSKDQLPPICYFGDVKPNAPLLLNSSQNNLMDNIGFVIGPEAGLSQREEDILLKLGIQGVQLHPFILRTDTAPLVVAALLRHQEASLKQQ